MTKILKSRLLRILRSSTLGGFTWTWMWLRLLMLSFSTGALILAARTFSVSSFKDRWTEGCGKSDVTQRHEWKRLTFPARAESGGQGPRRPAAGGRGGRMHAGVVPLWRIRGDPTQVTLMLLDALTAGHVQPLLLTITARGGDKNVQKRICFRPEKSAFLQSSSKI